MRKLRANYWSCSEFSNWIRRRTTVEKPSSGTMQEWDQWKRESTSRSKFWHWFTEEFLDRLQNWVYFPADCWDGVRSYAVASDRKHHLIDTKLQANQWHDCDTRMFHGCFSLLVDFVEIECAWMNVVFDDAKMKQLPIWARRGWTRFKVWRSPSHGLATLQFWIDDAQHNNPKALQAYTEMRRLYLWWTVDRPAREATNTGRTTSVVYAEYEQKYGYAPYDFCGTPHTEDPLYQEFCALRVQEHEQEQLWAVEDETNLHSLISIRQFMWT